MQPIEKNVPAGGEFQNVKLSIFLFNQIEKQLQIRYNLFIELKQKSVKG